MWQNAFLVDDFTGSPLLSGLIRDSSAAREKLGPPADWPIALQSAARLLLDARYPALVCWGSDLTLLYNDAAIPILGQRHPAALGQPAATTWPELGSELARAVDDAVAGNVALAKQFTLCSPRSGSLGDDQLVVSCLPWPGDNGGVAGWFCAVVPDAEGPIDQRTVTGDSAAQTQRVLIVEHDTSVRTELEQLLQSHYSVQAVPDGLAALDAIERALPDLVLTNSELPRLDGAGLIRALRLRPETQKLPILMLSGQLRNGAHIDGQNVEADDYLAIPYSANELLARVAAHLEARRRRREDTQRAKVNESHFHALADTAPAMLWITNQQGECVYLSRGWCDFTGQTLAEGQGQGWFDVVHTLDLLKTREAYYQAVQRREPFSLDYRVRRADGVYCWVLDSGRPRYNDRDEYLGYIGSIIDITERKWAEEACQESEARLRQLADNLPAGFIYQVCQFINEPPRFNYVSAGIEPLIGITPAEVADRPTLLYETILPEDADRVRAQEEICFRDRAPFDCQFRQCARNGEVRWLHARSVPRAMDESLVLWDGIAVDITDQVELEQSLRDADRRKDEFLSMLAHELRNPLAPLKSAAVVLSMLGDDSSELNYVKSVIHRQVDHMTRLLDDLLDVSRITRGKISLQQHEVMLQSVLQHAVETVRPALDSHRHRLEIAVDDAPLRVLGDATRLEQVFSNLLANAAKYTPPGGEITLTAETSGNTLVVRVRDTGAGIAPAELPHVFDLFFQVDQGLAHANGGLGIGLTMVRELVRMHGGTVEAASDGLGRGSEFTVRLPLAPAADTHRHVGPAAPLAGSRSQRILIVDDNADAAVLLQLLMKLQGHDTRIAYDGPSALTLAAQYRPSIVLLDIGLPGMDGYEVAREMRTQLGDGPRIIAISGYGQAADRERSRQSGFDYHLVKPVDHAVLVDLLSCEAVS